MVFFRVIYRRICSRKRSEELNVIWRVKTSAPQYLTRRSTRCSRSCSPTGPDSWRTSNLRKTKRRNQVKSKIESRVPCVNSILFLCCFSDVITCSVSGYLFCFIFENRRVNIVNFWLLAPLQFLSIHKLSLWYSDRTTMFDFFSNIKTNKDKKNTFFSILYFVATLKELIYWFKVGLSLKILGIVSMRGKRYSPKSQS